jgi:hypothetical protein
MDREVRLDDGALNFEAVKLVLAGEEAILLAESSTGTICRLEVGVEGVQRAGVVGEDPLLLHLPPACSRSACGWREGSFNDIPHLLAPSNVIGEGINEQAISAT